MGISVISYRLAPTADSLRSSFTIPSSSQFLFSCKYFITSFLKCQIFFSEKPHKICKKSPFSFVENDQNACFFKKLLDKSTIWWFNMCNCMIKDNDGKYANFKRYRESTVGVSRYGRIWCSPSRVGLVKAKASNETRIPPLQGVALFEAEE